MASEHKPHHPDVKSGPFEKIVSLLCGIFLTPLIIAIVLKLFPSFYGALAGTVLAILVAAYTYKKYPEKPVQKNIAIGMAGAIIVLVAGTGIFWIFIQLAYWGISG